MFTAKNSWVVQTALSLVLAASTALSGCTTTAVMYSGPTLSREKVAVVSTAWGSRSRNISALLVAIDGRPFDAANHREIHLLPGQHTLDYEIRANSTVSSSGTKVTTSWNHMTVSVSGTLGAGHTYIARAQRLGTESARIIFDDRGVNYPERCLPLALLHSGRDMDACDPTQ